MSERHFPVLERPFSVLERLFPGFWGVILSRDVPGHLLLPLSRDKGTLGQEFFFVPGQRDNGTSRPGLSRDVPSRGNPSINTSQLEVCTYFL